MLSYKVKQIHILYRVGNSPRKFDVLESTFVGVVFKLFNLVL